MSLLGYTENKVLTMAEACAIASALVDSPSIKQDLLDTVTLLTGLVAEGRV